MTTLAARKPRNYEITGNETYNDLPVIQTDIIYEGAAVGISSGYARPFVAGDEFLGFAARTADNSAGASGAIKVRLLEQGVVRLSVAGASAVTHVNDKVYATDDDTFTLTASGGTLIGTVKRWDTGAFCFVDFKSISARTV